MLLVEIFNELNNKFLAYLSLSPAGSDTKIGTTSPVQDFLVAVNKLGPKPACNQLCQVYTRFRDQQESGLLKPFYFPYQLQIDDVIQCLYVSQVITSLVQHDQGDHVTDCLRSLRECAVREGLAGLFNEYLKQAFTHYTVQQICKDNNMSLIHRSEIMFLAVYKTFSLFLSAYYYINKYYYVHICTTWSYILCNSS